MPFLSRLLVGLSLAGSFDSASAQTTGATSAPFGYSTVTLPANSETWVSVPFERPAVFSGQVASVAASVVTVAATPNWTANQFAYVAGTQPARYYLFFRSGAKEGHCYTVTANTANSLTLELDDVPLSGVSAGDSFRLVPYWTLGTLFPATNAGLVYTATTSPASPETVILPSDPRAPAINPSSAGFMFYSGAWRQVGGNLSVSQDDQILHPGTYFRVRNGTNGGVLVAAGAVVMEKHAVVLRTQVGSPRDNPVALLRPLPLSLNDAGLVGSGAFASSSNALARSDMLMVFDNTEARLNKPATDYFIFHGGGWRKLGQPLSQDFGNEIVFGPAKGVVIRKAATTDGAPQTWVNRPSY